MHHVRLLISGILIVAFTVLSFAITKESPNEVVSEELEDIIIDRLRDISYRPGNRKDNFSAFGLWDEEVERALEIAEEAEKYKSKLILNFEQVRDVEQAVDVFCGHESEIRPRYAALRFAVHVRGENRVPMKMKRIKLKPQNWVDALALNDIYADNELVKDAQPDATVMVIASILSNSEDLLIDRQEPFGRGYKWSWKKAKIEFPEVQEAVIEYLANMHVMVEVAQGPDGICD